MKPSLQSRIETWYRKTVPSAERRNRKLWKEAYRKVALDAKRRRNMELAGFAAVLALSCSLVEIG